MPKTDNSGNSRRPPVARAPAFPKIYSGETAAKVEWHVLHGDADQALSLIAPECVDCVVTSPPYFWLRDYGVSGQIGLEDTVGAYVSRLAEVFDKIFTALRPTGTVFLNLGDTYYSGKGKSHGRDSKSKKRRFGLRAVDKSGGMDIGIQRKSIIGIPWRVAQALGQRGWVVRSPIIWHRDKCLPEAVTDRPRRSYEFVFMLAKSRHYFFDRTPLIERNIDEDVWTISPRTQQNGRLDTAPFPEELVERCLSIGCPPEGLVLDPFAGSGTTPLVAVRSGRPAIGIDVHRDLCRHMVARLSQEFL
ncbi:MAG TPA: site-specific DNA-methyltransferase [Chthoniobacterales bacterium]|nr:site-specific DNA-methyltransferase [Chthoniobacterales bacterium]